VVTDADLAFCLESRSGMTPLLALTTLWTNYSISAIQTFDEDGHPQLSKEQWMTVVARCKEALRHHAYPVSKDPANAEEFLRMVEEQAMQIMHAQARGGPST
jgi:hypothetical protein